MALTKRFRRRRGARRLRRSSRRKSRSSYKRSRRTLKRGRRVKRRIYRGRKAGKVPTSKFSTAKLTGGKVRKMNHNSFQAKVLRLLTDKVVYRFGGINPLGTTVGVGDGGYYWMWNQSNGTDQVQSLPVHFYDVSGCIQGLGNANAPGFQLYKKLDRSAGMFFTGALSGDTNTVNGEPTSYYLQLENTAGLSTNVGYVGDQGILQWLKVDLLLRGKQSGFTRFYVDLVQFDVDVIYGTKGLNGLTDWPALSAQSDIVGHADATWQKLAKNFVGNPIAIDRVRDTYNGVKFLKHWEFTLNADSTDDMDPNPVVKKVSIFERMNRKCDYDWVRKAAPGGIYPEGNTADLTQPLTQLHPKARVYLMIRADVPGYNGENPSIVYMPSYDMQIRTQFLVDNR